MLQTGSSSQHLVQVALREVPPIHPLKRIPVYWRTGEGLGLSDKTTRNENISDRGEHFPRGRASDALDLQKHVLHLGFSFKRKLIATHFENIQVMLKFNAEVRVVKINGHRRERAGRESDREGLVKTVIVVS